MSDTKRQESPAGTRFSVLVVDDEPDHRFLIENRLRSEGIHVESVGSGDAALARLDGIDLVLLDYVLPGRSGLETLRSIREMNGPSVILVTAMGSESIAIEAMRAGAVDYLIKDQRYLQALPQVVERAWRAHDLARKAREMQRLALLVSSAADRETVFAEIVSGARSLLRAEACQLYLAHGDGLALKESAGRTSLDEQVIRDVAVSSLSGGQAARGEVAARSSLMVPVRAADGSALGVLAVVAEQGAAFVDEEADLAVTFASFCGLALGHLKQLELERAVATELQEMLELRRELVAAVSHELRTPLTCILGFASTLDNHWDELAEDARHDFVAKVRKHGLELAELVDGLLDFASTEAGRLQAANTAIDAHQVAGDLLNQLSPILAEREVTLSGQSAPAVGDPILVARALSNLLSNAVKYSQAGSPIEVSVVPEGEMVRVSVKDAGIGMSPEEAERAFEPFWRAGRGITRKRGTGIGLGLVRDYVRIMGGTVSVVSAPGAGSTFSFTLPARA